MKSRLGSAIRRPVGDQTRRAMQVERWHRPRQCELYDVFFARVKWLSTYFSRAMFGEKTWNMTRKLLKILSVFFLVAGPANCYTHERFSPQKSSYLNRELTHFRNRLSTTERYREKIYHSKNIGQTDPHKIRHNRFTKLDQLYTKITDAKTDEFTYNPFKSSDSHRYRTTEKPYRRYSAVITTTTAEPDLNEDYDITEDETEDKKDNILKKKVSAV